MAEYKTNYWIDHKNINNIAFSSYWNDEEKEKNKEWYVLDGNFDKMEEYLKKVNLKNSFLNLYELTHRHNFRFENKTGLNLAAGTLWLEGELFKLCTPKKIYSVEMSKHRLLKIGPKVLDYYKVPHKNIELCLGSFYDIKLEDNSIDFILLSSAFHHAAEPNTLMKEIKRVLKDDGFILLMGESEVEDTTRSEDDILMGDFYYTKEEYISMFKNFDYNYKNVYEKIGTTLLYNKNLDIKSYSNIDEFINESNQVAILGSGNMGLRLNKYLSSQNKKSIFVHDTQRSSDVVLLSDIPKQIDSIIIAIGDRQIASEKLKSIPKQLKCYIASTNDYFYSNRLLDNPIKLIKENQNIAVYGAGKIGKCFYKYLTMQNKTVYLIDTYKKNKFYEKKIYELNEIDFTLDLIIITIENYTTALKIEYELKKKYQNVVILPSNTYNYYIKKHGSLFLKIKSFFTCK